MPSFKISPCAASLLETDVFELALEPDKFGLNAEESEAYMLLASSVNAGKLKAPSDAGECRIVCGLLTDLANAQDDIAEDRSVDSEARKFARSARQALGNLAVKISHVGIDLLARA